jgi:hypothetical protein
MEEDTCPICHKKKKIGFNLCYACYTMQSRQKDSKTESENIKAIKDENLRMPSHTELYKYLNAIEEDILKEIFRYNHWTYTENFGYGYSGQNTKYKVKLEQENWDIVFEITESPEPEVEEYIKKRKIEHGQIRETSINKDALKEQFDNIHFGIWVEYKSSIIEWGKQVDQYFRQVKSRYPYNQNIAKNRFFIISFDERFHDYDEAFRRAEIHLIILSKELLAKFKAQGKPERPPKSIDLNNPGENFIDEEKRREEIKRIINHEISKVRMGENNKTK